MNDDDNGKFRLERVKLIKVYSLNICIRNKMQVFVSRTRQQTMLEVHLLFIVENSEYKQWENNAIQYNKNYETNIVQIILFVWRNIHSHIHVTYYDLDDSVIGNRQKYQCWTKTFQVWRFDSQLILQLLFKCLYLSMLECTSSPPWSLIKKVLNCHFAKWQFSTF